MTLTHPPTESDAARDPSNGAEGSARLARDAEREKRWPEALRHWEEALAQAGVARPAWRHAHAMALLAAGRVAESQAAARAVVTECPDWPQAEAGLLRTLTAFGQPPHLLLRAVEEGLFRRPLAAPIALARVEALIRSRRMSEARAAFAEAAPRSDTAPQHTQAFMLIPRLFEGEAREGAWRSMLAALPEHDGEGVGQNFAMLRARLLLALGEHAAFLRVAEPLVQAGGVGRDRTYLGSVVRALRGDEAAGARPRKVFCIGLSKTGTSSIRSALELLGFVSVHWTNPLTNALLTVEDARLFDAMSDIAVSDGFEALHAAWPDARFILTRRALPDWETSFARHYARAHGTGAFAELARLVGEEDHFPYGLAWRQLHQNLYFRHASLAAAWTAHEDRVARFFRDKPGALLTLDLFAGEGWPQLCAFLHRAVPDLPFPWENASPATA